MALLNFLEDFPRSQAVQMLCPDSENPCYVHNTGKDINELIQYLFTDVAMAGSAKFELRHERDLTPGCPSFPLTFPMAA